MGAYFHKLVHGSAHNITVYVPVVLSKFTENSTCSQSCLKVSVRQTQHHNGLSDQPRVLDITYVIERSRKLYIIAAHLDEELRLFSFDQEVLRELGSIGCTVVDNVYII